MLKEKIIQDLKGAMKAGDIEKTGVLRMLSAALHNREIEKGKDAVLTEDEVVQVLMREAKKRREAIDLFIKGNRPELADKEKGELKILEFYLPKQMGREEIMAAVERVIVTFRQAQGDIVFNNIMKAVMAELKGKADGKTISEIVKEKLG